jgi:transposase
MPAPHPREFRTGLLSWHGKTAPVVQIAKDLGMSESCVCNWMARADIEKGKEDLTSSERKDLARLRAGYQAVKRRDADELVHSDRPIRLSADEVRADPYWRA